MTESAAWLFFRRQRPLQPPNCSPPECSQSSTSCNELQPGVGGRQAKVQELREAASINATSGAWQQLAQALQHAHALSCVQQLSAPVQQAGQCGTAAAASIPPLPPLPPTCQHASSGAATIADSLPRPVKRQRLQPGTDMGGGGGAAGAAWTGELLQAFRAYQILYLLKQVQGVRRAGDAVPPLLPDPILKVLALELAKRYVLPGTAAAQLAGRPIAQQASPAGA